MEVSKIQFSSAEEELMKNAEIILTKNRVLEKWKQMLERVQENEREWVEASGLKNHELFKISGKVSRGDQYLGLPWLILDYPRSFTGRDLFFIRQMFWWGNFFSITLHLGGKYKDAYLPVLIERFEVLRTFSLGIADDPWIHHFEADNYISLAGIDRKEFENRARSGEHFKMAIAYPLEMWQEAENLFLKNWLEMLEKLGLVTNAV